MLVYQRVCYIAKLRDEADYFYVVQSGSFQVSKTEAAASAEKILGFRADFVQISCRFRADFVTFLLKSFVKLHEIDWKYGSVSKPWYPCSSHQNSW